MLKRIKTVLVLCVGILSAPQAYSSVISCVTLVESGEALSTTQNYYERFDNNANRVLTRFNFDDLFLTTFDGIHLELTLVGTGVYLLTKDPRYKYLVGSNGRLVIEARVDSDATTLKVFECD